MLKSWSVEVNVLQFTTATERGRLAEQVNQPLLVMPAFNQRS
jgi:hypothetical protein